MIDFDRGHTAIVGMTGTGKTYTTLRAIKTDMRGALFINTMHGSTPRGYVRLDGSASMENVIEMLEDGEKLNFLPDTRLEFAEKQLAAIVDYIFREKRKPFILVVDEAHLWRKEGLQALIRAVTTGRQWGITLVTITQRLAKLDQTIMTQSPQKVFFLLENEGPYCDRYGIPYDAEIEPKILQLDPGGERGGKYEPSHAFCSYFMGRVEGAYKWTS